MNLDEKQKILFLIGSRKNLISSFLFQRSYDFVKKVLELKYWEDKKFQPLLKSNIWYSNYEEIVLILKLKYWEDEKFRPLLTSTMWERKATEIVAILELKYWEDEKYQSLLTSSIWTSSKEAIEEKLNLEVWNNDKYEKLLTPSIFSITKEKILGNIKLFEELGIEDYININALRKNPEEQRIFFKYLIDNGYSLVVDDKLKPLCSMVNSRLKKYYNIDYKAIVNSEGKKYVRV